MDSVGSISPFRSIKRNNRRFYPYYQQYRNLNFTDRYFSIGFKMDLNYLDIVSSFNAMDPHLGFHSGC